MNTNSEVVELVKKLTAEQNMSMSELARRVGIAKSAISRYFNGITSYLGIIIETSCPNSCIFLGNAPRTSANPPDL